VRPCRGERISLAQLLTPPPCAQCDRKVPCTACLKRGDAEACNWEVRPFCLECDRLCAADVLVCPQDAKIEPEKQPFALAVETDDLRARLSLIERFINKLPDPLKTTFKELGISQMGDLPRHDLRKAEVDFGAQFGSVRALPTDKPVAPPDSLGLMDNLLFSGLKSHGVEGLQQPDHPDLTSMLTSIVAPRVVYTNPSVSTNLGLDPCFNQEELDAERLRVLDKIYSQLPNRRDCDVAVDRYFQQFDWFFSILHHATWKAEYVRFWDMLESGRKYEVDPAWLAILYLVRPVSLLPPCAAGRPSLTYHSVARSSSRFRRTSRCTSPARARPRRRRRGRSRARGTTPARRSSRFSQIPLVDLKHACSSACALSPSSTSLEILTACRSPCRVTTFLACVRLPLSPAAGADTLSRTRQLTLTGCARSGP